jgi:2'-5' RNA ligase
MRLFIAINFDPRVRDLIAHAIESFPVDRPPWRWTRPETWHLTLKFLGEVPESDIAPLYRCLEQVAARHPVFAMELKAFGGFPNLRRPRVLFYDIDEGAGRLRRMAADVDQTLLDVMGVPAEDKPFRAHATVGRVKTRLPGPVADKLKIVSPLEGGRQQVASIDLMMSELRREGARYECLKGFALPPAS